MKNGTATGSAHVNVHTLKAGEDTSKAKKKMFIDDPLTIAEVEKAKAALSSGKAHGSDAIPAKVYKAGGTRFDIKINELFETIWSAEGVPQEFKDASIVHLYKRKSNRQCCDKHRDIALLSIVETMLHECS